MDPTAQNKHQKIDSPISRDIPSSDTTDLGRSSFSERIRNTFLGESIAPGVFITFINGHPEMHLLKTDAKSTFRDIRSARDKLARIIEEHGCVSAKTPSSDAARILMLALRKIGSHSEETVKAVQALGNEIKGINLRAPSDPHWSRELAMSIGGSPVRIILKLEQNEFSVSTKLSRDLSAESKLSKYSYQVSIERTSTTKQSGPAPFRSAKFRKDCEWGGRLIPVGACFLGYLGSSVQAAITSAVGGWLEPVAATVCIIGAVEFVHRKLRDQHYLQK